MKILKKLLILSLALGIFMMYVGLTHAMTPMLNLTQSGGDSVTVNVNGDANANVALYYNSVSSGTQTRILGVTNMNGFLSTTVSTSSYGISGGTYVYVMVNNTVSSSVLWPYGSGNNSLALSQTNLSLSLGQTVIITATNNYNNGALYVSSNSNSNIVSAYASNNGIAIVGNAVGYTTVFICQGSGTTYCGTVYVTVGGGSYNNNNYPYNNTTYPYYQNSNGAFSVSSLTLSVGDSATITSTGNVAGVYAENNPNSQVSSISYSTLYGGSVVIKALALGTNNISMCLSSNNSNCSTINVNVVSRSY